MFFVFLFSGSFLYFRRAIDNCQPTNMKKQPKRYRTPRKVSTTKILEDINDPHHGDSSRRVVFPPRFQKTGLPNSRTFSVFTGRSRRAAHPIEDIEYFFHYIYHKIYILQLDIYSQSMLALKSPRWESDTKSHV